MGDVSVDIHSGADTETTAKLRMLLNNFTGADKVYIACGYTNLRRGIDGLSSMVR